MPIKAVILTLAFGTTCLTGIAFAGQAAQEMGTCMADSMTGKERKEMAKWVFIGLSAHPDMKELATISEATRTGADKFIGQLITRLLTEDCPSQAKVAVKEEGNTAFKEAFELVGKIATQELMTNPDVLRASSGWQQFVDKQKMKAVFPE